ncbi:MAG TPA: hypothetical protein VII92_06740, partial [Anaerolineae bacterium]
RNGSASRGLATATQRYARRWRGDTLRSDTLRRQRKAWQRDGKAERCNGEATRGEAPLCNCNARPSAALLGDGQSPRGDA